MSFSSTGFEVESYSSIMTRIYETFSAVLPNLEFTPDNIITHWQEILAYEQRLTQIMLADAINNFSTLSATGIFLDRLGIEAGVIRKGGVAAAGYVYVNGESDSDGVITTNSAFSTDTELDYYTLAERTYTNIIGITRGFNDIDDVPSPYANVTVDGLYTTADTEIGTELYSIVGDTVVWNINGIDEVTGGDLYYIKIINDVDLITPVIASTSGNDYNASANRIIQDGSSYSFVNSVTNPNPFYTGSDIESDEDYKYRIVKAKRKTFTLGRIESLCENLEGVRDAKTYQVTNTDKNSISTDWSLNNLTGYTGTILVPSGEWFGFSFVPSDDIATMKEFKMYGRVSGSVIPKLEYYLKDHYAGAFNTGIETYLSKNSIEKDDLIRDNITGWQEMTMPLKYNGLDNAKVYRLYMRESGFILPTSGHWEFAYETIVSSEGYTGETYLNGTGQATGQVLHRTMYGSPAYNVDITVEDGYRFDPEITDEIEKLLNYEDYDGNSPVCIQYDIRRATKVYMSMSVYVYPEDEYSFADVLSDIKTSVGTYLRSVKSGTVIYYTKVENAIMNTNGVKKISNLLMKVNDGDWSTKTDQNDIGLSDQEYVDLDLLASYDGVAIYEG